MPRRIRRSRGVLTNGPENTTPTWLFGSRPLFTTFSTTPSGGRMPTSRPFSWRFSEGRLAM